MQIKNFPTKKYKIFRDFYYDYSLILSNFLIKRFDIKLNKAVELIQKIISKKKTIFICGNGGSSSISNHYVCDYVKSLSTDTNLKPRVISLNSNNALISAISNDISHDKIFSYQLNSLYQKGDLLIILSSSGESKNVRDAVNFAKRNKISIIGFSGFDGGYLKKYANISIHVDINNYGITEDIFQIHMHIIMQYLRQKNIKKKITKLKF
jgi:phosphoheptose isomerase